MAESIEFKYITTNEHSTPIKLSINVLLLLAIGFLLMPIQAQDTAPNLTPTHVIVISIDGARPDAIHQVNAPNLQTLAEQGAVSWQAQTVLPPVTVPAHASLLTGLDVSQHGVDHNNYSTEELGLPTFLSIAAEHGYQTAMIVGKNKLDQFHYPASVQYTFALSGDGSVVDAAITALDIGAQVMFVHLPNPDYFGHLSGWMSDQYLDELQNTDLQIGRLLDALDERRLSETTLLIITADHGGHDTVHGADIPEDTLIPVILNGTGVHSGTELENVSITQIAPTVLYALNLPIAEDMARPLYEAFGQTELP